MSKLVHLKNLVRTQNPDKANEQRIRFDVCAQMQGVSMFRDLSIKDEEKTFDLQIAFSDVNNMVFHHANLANVERLMNDLTAYLADPAVQFAKFDLLDYEA